MVENKIKGEYKGLGARSVPTDVMCAFGALARSTDLLVLSWNSLQDPRQYI